MSRPILLVIAGCNGSGKSTFSKELSSEVCEPFDYDFYYLKNYQALLDIDIKAQMAHNVTWQQLEIAVTSSISNGLNFCYETNFNDTPLHWPKIFKEKGYIIRMIYFCLNSIDLFDTSSFGKPPKHILSFDNNQNVLVNVLPEYLNDLIPSLIAHKKS